MTLSEANDFALALLLGVAAFWLVNFCLRLAGHLLYWLTFWALVIGLPALAIHWFSTPWQMERGRTSARVYRANMPSEPSHWFSGPPSWSWSSSSSWP